MKDELKASVVSCQLFTQIFSDLCDCHMQRTTDYGRRTTFHSSFILRFALLHLFERGAFVVGGDAIVFVSPVAEVYQLAAFGTERAVRVIFPPDWLFAFRAFHKT